MKVQDERVNHSAVRIAEASCIAIYNWYINTETVQYLHVLCQTGKMGGL